MLASSGLPGLPGLGGVPAGTPPSIPPELSAEAIPDWWQVLFCKLTKDQRDLYRSYLASQEVDDILEVSQRRMLWAQHTGRTWCQNSRQDCNAHLGVVAPLMASGLLCFTCSRCLS